MTQLSTPLNCVFKVKPEWRKCTRKELIENLGYAYGYAIFYGLKQRESITVVQTRHTVSFADIRKISLAESANLYVHFDFANLKVSKIMVGTVD